MCQAREVLVILIHVNKVMEAAVSMQQQRLGPSNSSSCVKNCLNILHGRDFLARGTEQWLLLPLFSQEHSAHPAAGPLTPLCSPGNFSFGRCLRLLFSMVELGAKNWVHGRTEVGNERAGKKGCKKLQLQNRKVLNNAENPSDKGKRNHRLIC